MPPAAKKETKRDVRVDTSPNASSETAKKKEIRERIKREFRDIITDDKNANLVLDIIYLPEGLTLGIGGFILGGGVQTGITTQERFEKFIKGCRSELSLSAVTVEKPRPDAGPPGVDWSISVTT
ncbi:MAG: hypothetical protein HZA34_01610 [Candidatus Pacebacteria bacterium]|nr:hypothetical protein [Candidatus Paceibacterota bacterium]